MALITRKEYLQIGHLMKLHVQTTECEINFKNLQLNFLFCLLDLGAVNKACRFKFWETKTRIRKTWGINTDTMFLVDLDYDNITVCIVFMWMIIFIRLFPKKWYSNNLKAELFKQKRFQEQLQRLQYYLKIICNKTTIN